MLTESQKRRLKELANIGTSKETLKEANAELQAAQVAANAELQAALKHKEEIDKELEAAKILAIRKIKTLPINNGAGANQAQLKQLIDQAAQDYNTELSLNKELKTALNNAPDKPTKLEIEISKKILDPFLDKSTEILNQADNINNPQELKDYLKNVYKPYIKQTIPTIKQFYNELKQQGQIASRPHIEMLLSRSDSDLAFLKAEYDFWQKSIQNK